jgi:spore germination protein (amino acid permease)
MKNYEKVSPLQVILLLSVTRIAIVLLWFNFKNQDIWIVQLFSLVYVAILSAPLLYLSKQYSNLTAVEYFPVILGNLVSKLLGTLYAVFFLFLAALDLSLFDNIIRPINFPATPDAAIILIALAACAYSVYNGLECIARSAEIFTPMIFFVVVLYAILQIPLMDFKVFLPIMADSTFWEINSQAFLNAARFHEIVVLAMLAPSINRKGNTITILSWAAIIITVYSLIIILSTLAWLGLDVAKKTFDPYYLFIRQINIYDFITRIEFLIVGAWNVGMFLKISLMLHLAIICLVQTFGLKYRKIFIIPLAIIIFITALTTDLLKSVIVFTIIETYVPYINLIFMFCIPTAVLAIFLLKKALNYKNTCNS